MEQLNIMQKVQRYQLQIDLINLKVRGEQMPFRHIPQWDERPKKRPKPKSPVPKWRFFFTEFKDPTGRLTHAN